MASLVDKWRNWRDVSKRKKAASEAIGSRNPETAKAAFANLKPEEISSDEKARYLRDAIDEQNVAVFKEVLRFVDDPNLEIGIDKGGRYVEMHYYSPLAYALSEARTHDISLTLAGDPRVAVKDEDLETAKNQGMTDVAAVLTHRVADVRRHEADLRLQEAAHLDQEAAAKPADAPAPAAKPANQNEDVWALMSETSVAHMTSSPVVGRKLTEIFKFDDKERVTVSENLKTGAESPPTTEKFENLSADTVRRAEEKLKALNAEAAGTKRTFSL
jgi:hypothetical protein